MSDSSDGTSEPTGNFDPENDDSDSDPPPRGILHAHFYNNNPRLPVYRYGLTEGMPTKEIVKELLNVDDDSRAATAIPSNVQHNSAFIVDTWCLDDVWDIKSDDMGSWTNQGRKKFKKGTMAEEYDTYRQSYTHCDLTSLKKYLVYLQDENGSVCR